MFFYQVILNRPIKYQQSWESVIIANSINAIFYPVPLFFSPRLLLTSEGKG